MSKRPDVIITVIFSVLISISYTTSEQSTVPTGTFFSVQTNEINEKNFKRGIFHSLFE